MDLLHPRQTYHRANSEDPGVSHDAFELTFINSKNDSKHDTPQAYNFDHPLIKRQDHVPLRPSPKASWFSGWRTGAYCAATLASCSLIINIIAAVWLSRHPDSGSNLVEVYKGSCETVTHLDTWVHLVINVLSTLLLGGSNYCMQCLCAPTRAEVDKAHARGRYLDIGVPSLRNLTRVATHKHIMWWLLAISSIPLHLMYNSAFYSSLANNNYDIVVVSHDFLSDGAISYDADPDGTNVTDQDFSVPARQLQQEIASNDTAKFQRLDAVSCIKAYGQVFLQDYRNLVIVSKNSSVAGSNSSVLVRDYYNSPDNVDISKLHYRPFDWICSGDWRIFAEVLGIKGEEINEEDINVPCDSYLHQVEADAVNWSPYGAQFDYCLAEQIEQQCSFNGNIPIVITVILCNVLKVILMLIVAVRLTGHPLVTIGDALESFLEVPDQHTKDLCLFTRSDAGRSEEMADSRRKNGQAPWQYKDGVNPRSAKIRTLRWRSAASGSRWTLTIGLILLALLTVAGLFVPALSSIKRKSSSTHVASLGFGKIQASSIISGWGIENISNQSVQVIAAILVANSPQIILSFLYLNLNGLLTSMWAESEWSRFARERKYLRVSTEKGQQRSKHFLQLPYKIAVPLMMTSGLLHWLLSQSIFLAVVASYDDNGTLLNPLQIASCGFSPLAMILVLVLGVLIIVGTILIGRQKYDSSMPLAGSCSAAISAACHRPDWDTDASLSSVQWGVIPALEGETGVGHCCFTSGEVEPIQDGKEYAGTFKLSTKHLEQIALPRPT